MKEMADRLIYPVAAKYAVSVAAAVSSFESAGGNCSAQKGLLKKINTALEGMIVASDKLGEVMEKAIEMEEDVQEQASYYHDTVVPAMADVRKFGDTLEKLVDKNCWPYPSYEDLLFIM